VADGPLFSFRIVPQPDRRQRPDRRAVWRGGRRTSDVGVTADLFTGGSGDSEWGDEEDDEDAHSDGVKAYVH
jgi:hypothetical protein